MSRWTFAVILLVACDCDSTTTVECSTSDDCPLIGQVCIDAICVLPADGGMDASPDTAPPPEDCVDMDGDGAFAISAECEEGDDCDDSDASTRPGASETCGDGADNDCDGEIDEPDCDCSRGDRISCFEGSVDEANVGICRRGIAICESPGMVGECRGQVLAIEETCDGTDEDCDGDTDEGLRNACGECSDVDPEELCGNEIDDDCDGMVDEDCDCDYRCMCPEGTSCECTPPTNQPCYEGPFGTGGQGVCLGGVRDCVVDGEETRWAECTGQTLPSEECEGGANGDDDDCDGAIDEGCRDSDGDGVPFPMDCDDSDADISPAAAEVCNGRDDNCDGVADEGVTNGCGGCGEPAATDECGNGLDDDCNGVVDDRCGCTPGESTTCYGGPDGTQGIGECRAGMAMCGGSTEFPSLGECSDQVTPLPEICNGVDDDCDGEEDERWATGSNACGFCDPTEVCDGMDQDCDGRVDEGVSNACGECGPEPVEVCNEMDDDCDGVTDEGTTNACGLCEPEPCYTDGWPELADCEVEGRVCDDVEENPDFPGSITLGSSTVDFDYIYIAVTGRNQVAQIDTSGGPRDGMVNWQVTSHGRWPSRTAVTSDGSVWVSNRAYTGSNPLDPAQSNVVHLSEADGSLICRAPVLNVARSLAIDRNGDVWAGSYNNGDLYHISGTDVIPPAPGSTDPPTCRVIRMINTARNIYGLTADADGFVWTSSSPTVRVNIDDYTTTEFANPSHYGIAADGRNQVWFGGWRGSGTVHALDRTTGDLLDTTIASVTAITVHPEGSVWGSSYGTNEVVGIDGETGVEICRESIGSGANPHGVGVDRTGRIWVPSRYTSGGVSVYDTECNLLHTYVVDAGQELYSYSDMTGHLLRTFVSPEGNWSQVFDSGYARAYWTTMEWTSIEPDGTAIEMSARTADTLAELDAAVPCGPFLASPADLSTCPADFQRKRFLRVEARLTRTGEDRPTLRNVEANWAY